MIQLFSLTLIFSHMLNSNLLFLYLKYLIVFNSWLHFEPWFLCFNLWVQHFFAIFYLFIFISIIISFLTLLQSFVNDILYLEIYLSVKKVQFQGYLSLFSTFSSISICMSCSLTKLYENNFLWNWANFCLNLDNQQDYLKVCPFSPTNDQFNSKVVW